MTFVLAALIASVSQLAWAEDLPAAVKKLTHEAQQIGHRPSGPIILAQAGSELKVGSSLALNAVSDPSEIAGAWNQVAIVCAQRETPYKIDRFNDTRDSGNTLSLSPSQRKFHERRASTEQWREGVCTPFEQDGELELVDGPTVTLKFKYGPITMPGVGQQCQVYGQFGAGRVRSYLLPDGRLALQLMDDSRYYSPCAGQAAPLVVFAKLQG